MKFFSTRFDFTSIRKSMVLPGVGAALVITLSTMNGCSQSDRSTESRDEVIAQNAAEAEAAEAKLAEPKAEDKTAGKAAAKSAEKPAAKTKEKKAAKAEKPVKAETHAKAEAHGKNETPSKAEAHVAEKAPQATPAVRKPAAVGGVYVVQVGAFKVKENAEKLQEKLSKAGYHVEMQSVEHSKNGTLHVVRIQPLANRTEAQTMIEDLQSKHDLKAQILTVSSATAKHWTDLSLTPAY